MNRSGTFRACKRVAPFLLLGPITGPLVAGVVLNFRDGRPVLATMYAILTIELTFASPIIAAALIASIR